MKRGMALIAVEATLAGCGQLDSIPYEPTITPQQWCQERPCVDAGAFVFNEPLGSFLVFLLAGLWVAAGWYLWRIRGEHESRKWWAIALVLGGVAALSAGISYQAFSYELKCAGRQACVWTNGFEVAYEVLQAASASAMVAGVAYACTTGALRRALLIYAGANAIGYTAILAFGVATANKFLLSFEFLLLFTVPALMAVLIITGARYLRLRDSMDAALFAAGVLLILVNAAYFAYYAGGFTQQFWDDGNGFYFSENDVLHVGMIGWILFFVLVVAKRIKDADLPEAQPAPMS